MLYEHRGQRPEVHPSATVADSAVLSGDVTVGPECRILHGAVLTSQGGTIELGRHCVVMENAVLRGTSRHPLRVGDHVLIGPHAYLTGCSIEDSVFLATGATVFNGAHIGTRSEVRVNGTVHLLTELPPDTTVPINWVAVGRPARLLPPDAHEEIWAIQEALNFPKEIFGLERPGPGETIMPELTERYARFLKAHEEDVELDD